MIVVTTPTGAIGRQVAENLLAAGEKIRVIVRDPSRLSATIRDHAEIVQGSHGDAAIVEAAFAGADALFWLAPPAYQAPSLDAVYADFSRPACAAIRHHHVKQVVVVSALGRGTGLEKDAGMVTATFVMDDLIAQTGAALRTLALPSFMDNLLRQVEPIGSRGVFVTPIDLDRKQPTCATRDIAAVAARLLADRSWSGRQDVPLLGPEDLSPADQARILSEALGKPVRCEQVPLDAFQAGMLQRGLSPAIAQGMADMMRAKNAGLDNAAARTPETASPTTFRQWCEEVLKPALPPGG